MTNEGSLNHHNGLMYWIMVGKFAIHISKKVAETDKPCHRIEERNRHPYCEIGDIMHISGPYDTVQDIQHSLYLLKLRSV